MSKLWCSRYPSVRCWRWSCVPHSRSQKSRIAATKSFCSSVKPKSTGPPYIRAWGQAPQVGAGLDICSIRTGQAEHMVADERLHQIVRDWSRPIEAGLAKLALDVVLLGEAEATVGVERGV